MPPNRVLITGLGAVSSIGIGKDNFWNAALNGKSGISEVTLFDTTNSPRKLGGQIKNFVPSDFLPKNLIPFIGRASQFAIAATKLALEDAKLAPDYLKSLDRCGVILGTTIAESEISDTASLNFINNKWDAIHTKALIAVFLPSIARNVGYFFSAKGINVLAPNACAAGNYSIGYGYDLIRSGESDFVVAGGAEALSRIAFHGFQRLYAMAPEVCAPFDKNRKGMLLGEGAGILLLESEASAKKRGANVYAEVLGYGLSSDAYNMTIPKKEGIYKAIEKAMISADLTIADIDYISAHGTGTHANDKEESGAIADFFGHRHKDIPVSSIKSMLGHSLGAASALEAITCCLAINDNIAPPTINFETPDPDCDIDCVPNKARKAKIDTALNNGFAFGGNNCCVIFKRYSS